MIARRILAAVVLLWAFPCFAQTGSIKTPNQLNSEINTTFPDNSVGQITPAGLRQVTLDQVASVPFLNITNVFGASQSFPNGIVVNGGTITGAAITGGTITGLPTPVNPSDAVTLSYVNAAVTTGINILAPSRLATAAILPNTPTYANGTLGVGATLTAGSNSTLTVDGTVANLNDVVLVKNQGSAFQNGIYSLTTAGSGAAAWVLTRVSYFDQAAEMKVGSYTFVTAGSSNANASYTLQSAVTIVGTDPLTWALFSSTGTAVTSLDGTNGNITIAAGSLKVVSGQLSSNVLSSRAFAQTQNLSAFSAVRTLGYATAGDGGGATFQKTSSAFIDQTVDTISSAPTVTGGSGYTNGTYNAVPFGGGTGGNCAGQAIVSGGAVVQVQILMPCPGYTVGDVLTTPNSFLGGTGSGFSLTVVAVISAKGSFVDSVGTKFQIVTDQNAFPNVLQFGAVPDANGDGVTGTNDRPAFISALGFAYFPNFAGAANVLGTTVIIPKGAYLLCGGGSSGATIPIPQGIKLLGAGRYGGTSLFQCASESSQNHFFILCDIYTLRGQLGCVAEDFYANTLNAPAGSNIAVFKSTSGQQFELIHNVTIAAGLKNCLYYDFGLGGAANAIFNGVECQQNVAAVNNGVVLGPNMGGTLATFRDWVVECSGGPCQSNYAVDVQGTPYAVFNQFHIEGHANGFIVRGPGGSFFLRDLSEAGPCTTAVTLLNATAYTAATMENLNSSCTTTVLNNHSGGSSVSGVMYPQRTFNP